MDNWKQYLNYDIEINEYGHIRKKSNLKILTPSTDKDGYLWYMLRKTGQKDIKKFIHIMVMETFISLRPNPKSVCRHLDGDKKNNYYKNLAWGTPRDNTCDRLENSNDSRVWLTRDIIINIKKDLLNGIRQKDLLKKIQYITRINTFNSYRTKLENNRTIIS